MGNILNKFNEILQTQLFAGEVISRNFDKNYRDVDGRHLTRDI